MGLFRVLGVITPNPITARIQDPVLQGIRVTPLAIPSLSLLKTKSFSNLPQIHAHTHTHSRSHKAHTHPYTHVHTRLTGPHKLTLSHMLAHGSCSHTHTCTHDHRL